jgi:hypothetical protein
MNEPSVRHVIGLDLGQAGQHSALAILEQTWQRVGKEHVSLLPSYTLGHLKRWPLGTSYSAIVSDLAAVMASPRLRDPILAIDETGVGRAVIELFRQAEMPAYLQRIAITAAPYSKLGENGAWQVPRKDLAGSVQVLLESGRLQFLAVPERALLVDELLAFRVKNPLVDTTTVESWRERDHDDLVLATAIASWSGQKQGPPIEFQRVSIPERLPWYLRPSNAERRGLNGRGRRR